MPADQVREAIDKASRVYAREPAKARNANTPAVATLGERLRCEVAGSGFASLRTDMPRGIGGDGSGPNPGWLMRAGLASCSATCIAMRAAVLGIELKTLEVTVTSESDMRGTLGIDDSVPAGLQDLRINVRISAPGRSAGELEELVRWACSRSPVGCTDPTSARIEVDAS